MPRRPLPPYIAVTLSLLIVAATAGLWLRQYLEESKKPAAISQNFEHANPRRLVSKTTEAVAPTTESADPKDAAPGHSIPNERVLSFAAESDYRAFLANLPDDVHVVASNQRLLSVRIKVPERFDPSQLPPNAQDDPNYTLLTPLPVATDTLAADRAFGSSALRFMGALDPNNAGGQGVKIAVLDTGIRNHTTLDSDKLTQIGFSAPHDYLSHGTAVASLIAGQEGVGIAPQAELIGIQVLDTDGIGDAFTLAKAIVQAVDEGANIINMSLGSYGSNQALSNAVAYADSQGVVLVASAGNESVAALPYPAAYESVIAVSAIDAEGHPTSFSNQSASVDIAAPGVGVYAAWDDENWTSFTGTSAAAPYVSGAIASLSSALDITASEAAELLLANANDSGLPGVDVQLGRGYVDLTRSYKSNTIYTDLALADIYLAHTDGPEDQYTIHLTAQNRGTKTIPAAVLSYTLPNGITQEIYLGSLEPGQSASQSLPANVSELSLGLEISANVETRSSEPDTIPENNLRSSNLSIPEE
ncbi:S8 family serine peptidase [Pelagicoccus sp. NFK12]|uniref:S8 family serine peptidase n=1 Tax=Pelagicoccus enzymogenes TaxID=2773457 RepID=A0A927FAW4_9BACT|nr:S8 family serine peptidase [Pelagicoccus enzymogenes]MBD5781015.1 S8 family serine peptidase [Pelagicoccus enzymogenes]